ncbi:hypothetical protein [Cetobacterium sp.]
MAIKRIGVFFFGSVMIKGKVKVLKAESIDGLFEKLSEVLC